MFVCLYAYMIAGTHDLELLEHTLTQLARSHEPTSSLPYSKVLIPSKALREGRGDRLPSHDWTAVGGMDARADNVSLLPVLKVR